jgi:hypothetical protein
MFSIGILSYFSPKTLEHTLQSYKEAGLFDLTDDIFAVLQMSNRQNQEKLVCDSFNIRSICLPDNGKMASGFKAIYENARYDYILFLENDFIIKESSVNTVNFFKNCMYFLKDMNVDIVRGRSRTMAGEPNYARDAYKNYDPSSLINLKHLSECIAWIEDPELLFPSKISRIIPICGNDKWYKSTSASCCYTNNPYMCSKVFFEKAVLPYIKHGCTIEDLLTNIWSESGYICVFGPGLFTHERAFDGHY